MHAVGAVHIKGPFSFIPFALISVQIIFHLRHALTGERCLVDDCASSQNEAVARYNTSGCLRLLGRLGRLRSRSAEVNAIISPGRMSVDEMSTHPLLRRYTCTSFWLCGESIKRLYSLEALKLVPLSQQ